MAITPVGSPFTGYGTTLSVSPTAVGDLLVFAITGTGSTGTTSAVTGGGVTTWTKVVSNGGGSSQADIWIGQVTATGPSTITITSALNPADTLFACQQFTSGVGGSVTWHVDTTAGQYYYVNLASLGYTSFSNIPYLGTVIANSLRVAAIGWDAAYFSAAFDNGGGTATIFLAGSNRVAAEYEVSNTTTWTATYGNTVLTTGNAYFSTAAASIYYVEAVSGNVAATATMASDAAITKELLPSGNVAASAVSAVTAGEGFAPADKVPWMLPVAINDHPYVMDFQKSRITTMQIRRQATDESVEPGEQTLSAAGVWPRAQDNYFLGAGQEFLDNRFAFEAVYVHSGETPSVRTRYWKSQGVNPWAEGKMTLLNEYASIATSSSNIQIVVCGNYLYKTDGIYLSWTLNPVGVNTPSWTSVTMSNTHTIVSLTSDGSRVWAACGADGVYVSAAGTTSSASAATPAALNNVQGLLAYAAGAGTTNTTNLPNSSTTYYVTKVDAFGNETAATSVTITPAGTPINLNWQPDTLASSFNVYRGTSVLIYNGDVPSFVDDGSVVGSSQTRPTSNGTGVTPYPATFISYQKGHLIGSTGRDLVEILANGSVSFIYQHENPAFLWTCATECPSAIIVGGYAGSTSFIGAIQPDAATQGATLAPPVWASSLTPGEQINAIAYDSGAIILGTSLGIRSGTKPDSTGVFDVNPVIEDPGSVLCVASWSQYEYFGWSNYDPSENWAARTTVSGLGRADLSQYSTPGVPAYASDVMGSSGGSTTQVVVVAGVPYFVVNNSGAYTLYGPDGKLVPSGWMEPGWIRYGSLENKIVVEVDFQHEPLPSGSSVQYQIVAEDKVSINDIGTNSVAGSTTVKDAFSAGLIVGDRFMPIITLTADAAQTSGPVFLSHITKAMTTTKRNDEVLLALVWDDRTRTLGPSEKTWQMDLLAEYTYLKALEQNGNTVNLTMLSLVKVAYIDQVLLEPFDEVNDLRTFFRGTVTVKMITLS